MIEIFIEYCDDRLIFLKGKSLKNEEVKIEYKNMIKIPDIMERKELIKDILTQEKSKLKNRKYEVNLGFALRGILYREVQIPFMPLDDLEKMMELEIGEYLSIDKDEYECRYKILDKFDNNGQLFWNIAVAGIPTQPLMEIIDSLDEVKLKVKNVDILPNMYRKIFNKFINEDLMIVESCLYGCKLCILRENKVFLYADIPLDNEKMYRDGDYSFLINEINGYLEYFSSRNFGKNVGKIVFLGDYRDEEIAGEILANLAVEVADISNDQGIMAFSEQGIESRHSDSAFKVFFEESIEKEGIWTYLAAIGLLIMK